LFARKTKLFVEQTSTRTMGAVKNKSVAHSKKHRKSRFSA